jgi:hypothetical protein
MAFDASRSKWKSESSRGVIMQRWVLRLCLVVGLGLGAACAGDDGDGDTPGEGGIASNDAAVDGGGPGPLSDASTPMGPLLPLKEGNRWTYQVTGGEGVSTKVTTVGALEPVGGTGPFAATMAHRVVTRKGELDETVSWQNVEGDKVVRYREQAFGAMSKQLSLEEHWEPAKLRVDWTPAHLVAGARWMEPYKETKTTPGMPPETRSLVDQWVVDGVDVAVKVPAGEFRAIVLIKTGGSSQKTYWFVPGVGKVKETGGQMEELVEYQVAP